MIASPSSFAHIQARYFSKDNRCRHLCRNIFHEEMCTFFAIARTGLDASIFFSQFALFLENPDWNFFPSGLSERLTPLDIEGFLQKNSSRYTIVMMFEGF